MSDKLLPCPVAAIGGPHNLAIFDYPPLGLAYVKCSCGWAGMDAVSVQQAVEHWNTRPDSKPYKPGVYECENCHMLKMIGEIPACHCGKTSWKWKSAEQARVEIVKAGGYYHGEESFTAGFSAARELKE